MFETTKIKLLNNYVILSRLIVNLYNQIRVEMIFSNTCLGSVLWLAWETMRLTHMYSVLIIISIVGMVATWLLKIAKKKLAPWHQETRIT